MEHFSVSEPLPGIYHIEDVSKVCFTLIVGKRDTLLWDTGTGLYSVAACIAPYVRGNLHVVLSHGHYDHACGCHDFDTVYVHPDDMQLCRWSIGKASRSRVVRSAQLRGYTDDTFDAEQYLRRWKGKLQPFTAATIDLGDLEVRFLHTVGHTAGSIVAFLPDHRLLLTGDMWNPHTWLFFPESQPLAVYTASMQPLRGLEAEHVLCPHDHAMRTMDRLKAYIDGLNEQTFAKAEPVSIPPYTKINTYRCHPEPDSVLVFNGDKRV